VGRPDGEGGALDATIFAAGALAVVAGATTTGRRIAGAATAGKRIAGLVAVDLGGAGAAVVACGAGSGVGCFPAPDVGAVWGVGSETGLGVEPDAPGAPGQPETTRTKITVPQMRTTVWAAQEPASNCPRRRCTPQDRVANAPSIFLPNAL